MGKTQEAFIRRMVASGRYGSASEVLRAALRLLEEQESHNDAMRQAVLNGLSSGESALTLCDIAEQRKMQV